MTLSKDEVRLVHWFPISILYHIDVGDRNSGPECLSTARADSVSFSSVHQVCCYNWPVWLCLWICGLSSKTKTKLLWLLVSPHFLATLPWQHSSCRSHLHDCEQPLHPFLRNIIKFPELVRSYDLITLNAQTHSFLSFLNFYYLLPMNFPHSGANGTITKARNFFESGIEAPWDFTTGQTLWSSWLPGRVNVFNLEPITLARVTLTKELSLRLLIQ